MPFSSKSWEAPLSGKRLLTLWNALHGVEKRSKVGERSGVRWTRRWRKADSNHRSRSCERLFWALPIGDGDTNGGATYRFRSETAMLAWSGSP
jgi:hypothetical protein